MRRIGYWIITGTGENQEREKFYAFKEQINSIFKEHTFNEKYKTKHVIDMTCSVFQGNPQKIKETKKPARIEFTKGKLKSLEIYASSQEDAVKCMKYLHLR